MKKLGTALFIGAAAAGILSGAAGVAVADIPVTAAEPVVAPGEPDPTGTGSSSALTKVLEALVSGSAAKPTT
ncbi:hypothetical protein [Nocardia sp. NPDC050406]|uniref:hypothetical protein n=1 Tax=Nocardia sp. NPDC050406 TaxID=3364318 RepID=UPI0037BDA74C